MKISTRAFSILPLMLVSACATTSRPDAGNAIVATAQQAVDVTQGGASITNDEEQGTVAFPELQGTWQGRCVYHDPNEPDEGYVKSVFSFNGNEFQSNTVIYSDENCENILERGFFHSGSSMQIEGVVSRPAGGVNTSVGAVPFIDISFDQYMIDNQPMTGSMAAMFSPETQYDIVHIDGETFYLGDNSGAQDSSTIQLRPTKLNNDKAFVRQ